MDVSLLLCRGTYNRIGPPAHLLNARCIIQQEVAILPDSIFRGSPEKAFHGQRTSRKISVYLIVDDLGAAFPIILPHADIAHRRHYHDVVGFRWPRDLECQIPLARVVAESPPVAW